jgi:mRNA interferase HigB
MRVIAKEPSGCVLGAKPECQSLVTALVPCDEQGRGLEVDEKAFPHAKVLNAERVRFEIAHNTFRLIVAFNFRAQIAFIKFVGSHAEYNKVDALTVSQF